MGSYKKLSDEELIEQVRSRDQELYAQVVERYQEKLLRYAKYLINDSDKAADVVQESFIKAYVNLRGFNVKKKFSSWIYRIVHNEAVNYIKKYTKEVSLEANSEIIKNLSSDVNIEADYEKKELKEKMEKNLGRVPVKYREPLVLFYLEEKSYREISDILRLPAGTVGIRINRGKKYLALVYEKERAKNG